jgi:hypothetical protein
MRKGFVDHFFSPSTTLEKFDRMSYQEMGDFIDRQFHLDDLKRDQRKVVLSRQGRVRSKRTNNPLTLSKSYTFKENGIELIVSLHNGAPRRLPLWYGLEFNLSLAGETEATFTVEGQEKEHPIDTEASDLGETGSVKIYDNSNKVQFALGSDRAFSFWILPVRTTSYSGGVARKTYQGSCILPQWRLELEPGQSEELKVSIDLRKR